MGMGEHIAEVLTVLGFITLLFIGLAKWIISKTIDDVEQNKKDQKTLEVKQHNLELAMAKLENKITEDLADIKSNYLKRFDGIINTLNSHHEESIKEINKITIGIEKQQQFCFLIQEQKKKDAGHD